MAKKLTRAQWNALRVYNSHEVAKYGGSRLFVEYSGWDRWQAGGVFVRSVVDGFLPDPTNKAWGERSAKWFPARYKDRASTILAAQAWCSVQGYIPAYTEWERDPWGGWHPAGTIEAAAQARTEDYGEPSRTVSPQHRRQGTRQTVALPMAVVPNLSA